jgi:hypothetical protein
MNVGKVVLGFKLTDLAEAASNRKKNSELTLGELKQRFANDQDGKIRRRTGEILARALLNPAAALLAIAAIAFSTGTLWRYLAMPIAVIVILLFDMSGRVLLGEAALSGAYMLLVTAAIVLTIFTLPTLIYVLRFGEKFIIPASSRA